MTDEKEIKVPDEFPIHCPFGLGDLLFESMQKHKHKIAQIIAETGETQTYNDLLQRSVRVALHMRSKGITKQDVILLNTDNHENACIPFIAAHLLGAKIASLDPSIAPIDAHHLFNLIKPSIVFTVESAEECMTAAVSKDPKKCVDVVVFGSPTCVDNTRFSDYLKPIVGELEFRVEKVSEDDIAVILFSSGTTGLPKGISCSHLMMANVSVLTLKGFDGEVLLYYSTLYWISSVTILLASIIHGYNRIVVKQFDPIECWYTAEKYNITFLFVAPTNLVQLIKNKPCDRNFDISRLRSLITGGGPVPIEYIQKLNEFLPHTLIIQGYGQSETGIVTKFVPDNPVHVALLKKHPQSCGYPQAGYSLKVVDPETDKALGPHQIGEIRIKTRYQLSGYYGADMSQHNVWDADGFVRSGDLGYYNEDYCFFFVDRLKELLKYRSWHITPAKIESIILTHPEVAAAVIIGLPDIEDGDHPLALVVLQDNANVKEEELKQFVDSQLDDRHRLRGGLVFVPKLLITPTGKYRRSEMKRCFLNGISF